MGVENRPYHRFVQIASKQRTKEEKRPLDPTSNSLVYQSSFCLAVASYGSPWKYLGQRLIPCPGSP